jgi:hypothetical protein
MLSDREGLRFIAIPLDFSPLYKAPEACYRGTYFLTLRGLLLVVHRFSSPYHIPCSQGLIPVSFTSVEVCLSVLGMTAFPVDLSLFVKYWHVFMVNKLFLNAS